MNSLLESEFPLHETQSLRYDLMKALTDSDLGYKLPGDNPTLGELCREIGDIEDSYTHIGYRLSFLKSWNFKESKLTSANWCFVSVSARHVSIARLKSAKFS